MSEDASSSNIRRFNEAFFEDGITELKAINLIDNEFLLRENELLRGGNPPTAEEKILFITGGPDLNIRTAQTREGKKIYTKDSGTSPKVGEIHEFIAEVSRYFEGDKGEIQRGRIMSESADIIYNLIQLQFLDSENASLYDELYTEFCDSLGYTRLQGAQLALVKYEERYKSSDKSMENLQINLALREGLIQAPNDDEISLAFNCSIKILRELEARLSSM